MSSKSRRGTGSGGGGGEERGRRDDGAKKKKEKKSSKSDKCKKCATLLPLMYRMRAKLEELQPECEEYKLDLKALRTENDDLRRQLSMLKASTAAAAPSATPTSSMFSQLAAPRTGAPSPRAAATAPAPTKAPLTASTKGTEASPTAAPSTGQGKRAGAVFSPFAGRGAAPAVSNDLISSGGGTGGDGRRRAEEKGGAGAGTAVQAPAPEAARKERSHGEKVREWAAAVARQKRERANGGASDEAPGNVGGGGGGGGESGGSAGVAGGLAERGGGDGGRGTDGKREDQTVGENDQAGAKTKSAGSGNGNGNGVAEAKKGKEKKKGKKKEPVPQPTAGVFAAASFGFLDGGREGEEQEGDGDDQGGTSSDSDDSIDGNISSTNRQRPRKRARTTTGDGAGGRAVESSSTTGGARVPRTSSMLARGFQPRGSSGVSSQADGGGADGGGADSYSAGGDGLGYEEDWSPQQDEVEVEWYEDNPKDMEGLGWSQVWRRGDASAVAGVWEEKAVGGDGLGKRARAMAQKCRELADADIAAASSGAAAPESGGLVGPKALSALLRLELAGEVTMEGVLMAVLRGRSRKRDEGFLGRLALQLLAGIDGAHASSLSNPDVLTLVVEELEGLADVIAAPSTTPELKGTGWGRETRLALELLSKTLVDWMDQARRASELGGPGGADEDDNAGGYASMSFGNSKKKKKKAKEKQQGSDNPAGRELSGDGEGDSAAGEGLARWTAEAEAPVLWWWETDDAARVPWAVARLLGLLLRRLDQPERTEAVLHSILVHCLGGPARLLRFPLAFLEALPGHFFSPKSPLSSATSATGLRPTASGGSGGSSPRANGEGDGAGVSGEEGVDGREGEVLVPGLWRRAVTAAMRSLAGVGGGTAIVTARLALVFFGGDAGSRDGSGGGGGGGPKSNGDTQQASQSDGGERGTSGSGRETAAELAEKILRAIHALHKPERGEIGKDNRGECVLCSSSGSDGDDGDCGDDGDRGDDRRGACGGDDALAVSTGLRAVTDETDLSDGITAPELAVPRSRGELVAVEAIRALRVLGVGMESGGIPVGRSLVPVIRRKGVCQRAPALASHALAQCAGARESRSGGGPGVGAYTPARALDMAAANVVRTLTEALESDPEKWEAGQLEEGIKLSHGTKAQVASALLSLLKDRSGEAATDSERSIVEWTQSLKPQERLSTPLPLLMSVTGVLSRPPAHVINLTRRPYRWKAVTDVARRQGVWLYRHDAVDSQVLEASSGTSKGCISEKEVALSWATELNTMHDKDCEKETTVVMHPSERACAASHLDLWRRHKDSKLAPFMPEVHPDAVLILEDDARLQPGFLERAKATMLQAAAMDAGPKGAQKKKVGLNKAWDVLYLGHILPIPIMEGITFAATAKKKKAEKKNAAAGLDPTGAGGPEATTAAAAAAGTAGKEGPEAEDGPTAPSPAETLGLNVAPVTFAWGLHAYLLTRAAATRLVDNLPVSAPADIFVASFLAGTDSGRPVLAGRAVLPALVTTAGGAADGAAAVDEDAAGDTADVVSIGTRRAGVAHGTWAGFGGGPRAGGAS